MKKIIALLLAVLMVLSAGGYIAVAYAQSAINSSMQSLRSVSISGLDTSISKAADKSLSDTITISPSTDIAIQLQKYDDSKGDWVTKKTILPKEKNVKIKYPSDWKSSTISRWRLYIPESDTHDKFVSETINISARNVVNLKLKSKSACIIDTETGLVIYSKNMNKRLPMASTTKVMTALLTFENCKMDDKVKITSASATYDSGCLWMQKGDKYYVEDLMYAMMLRSSNDAAIALGVNVGGSVKGFAKMMNQKADDLGLENTHFVNPNGLTANKHYSSAYDMCMIHRELLKYNEYFTICKTGSYTVKNVKKTKSVYVKNTNKLINNTDGVIAGKTGFTTPAGYCFTCLYQYGGRTYAYTVLGSKNINGRWADCKKLMEYIRFYG